MRFPLATSVAASPAIPAARGGRSPAGAAVQGPGLVARVAVRSHASRGRGVASRSGAARPRRAHSARGPWFSLRGAAAGGTGRGGWPSYVEGADVSADRGRSHLRRRTAACQGRAGRRIRVGYRPRRAAASRCAEAVRRAIGARRNRSGPRRLPRAPCPRTGEAATSTKHGVGRGARATTRPRCGEVRPVVRSRPVPVCCAGAGAAAGGSASASRAGSAWVPQQSDGAAGRRRSRSARTAASPRRRHCSGVGPQRSRPPRGEPAPRRPPQGNDAAAVLCAAFALPVRQPNAARSFRRNVAAPPSAEPGGRSTPPAAPAGGTSEPRDRRGGCPRPPRGISDRLSAAVVGFIERERGARQDFVGAPWWPSGASRGSSQRGGRWSGSTGARGRGQRRSARSPPRWCDGRALTRPVRAPGGEENGLAARPGCGAAARKASREAAAVPRSARGADARPGCEARQAADGRPRWPRPHRLRGECAGLSMGTRSRRARSDAKEGRKRRTSAE